MPLYGQPGSDTSALHGDATGEIGALTEKTTPVSADVLVLEDSAASGAKKKVQVGNLPSSASSPACTEVAGSTSTTTTSTSDVLMTGMTITPAVGSYMVWFSGDLTNSINQVNMYTSIYMDGVKVAASERQMNNYRSSDVAPFACQAKVTVNGSQAIEGRWRGAAGTLTNVRRTLSIIKVT